MLDVDTFLTILYVMVDDLCHCRRPKRRPGPKASLSESEVITLAIFARWGRFASERDFYRYAQTKLRGAFPTLPDRSQFNRLVRSQVGLIEEVALYLAAEAMGNGEGLCQASTARRCPFWMPSVVGMAGLQEMPTSAGPTASDGTKASACSPLQIRPGLSRASVSGPHPPLTSDWRKRSRRWVASIRQVVETVYDKLFNAFGLWRERPHELEGLRARLAARVALHN